MPGILQSARCYGEGITPVLELCAKNRKKAAAAIATATAPATRGFVHKARIKGFILGTLLIEVGLLPVGDPTTRMIDHVLVKTRSGRSR